MTTDRHLLAAFSRATAATFATAVTAVLLGFVPAAEAHTLEGPTTVQADPDGSFYYQVVFTTDSAGDFLGGYELCGQEGCGGFNTTVMEWGDGFCEFEMPEGYQIAVDVYGSLVDIGEPGLVHLNFFLCPGGYLLDTEILPATSSVAPESPFDDRVRLSLTGPHPVREAIAYRLELQETSPVTIRLYSVTGALIADVLSREMSAGSHDLSFDIGANVRERVGSGVYYMTAESGGARQSIRLVLLR